MLISSPWAFVRQPVCETRTMRISRYEMLLRNLGDLSDHGRVLQHAETTGFIPLVDCYAASTALHLLEAEPTLMLSINVSAVTVDVLGSEFVTRLGAGLHTLPRLTIELTETVEPDMAKALAFREALRQYGITFSLDDFGPGYPIGLDEIRALRPDEIKLSGDALLAAINGDPTWLVQARAITPQVVAECIDTEAKRSFTNHHDIPLIQGYIVHPT